jgi:hypothetical protein
MIFKFIKKVIFAILSVVVLVMLIIGGVGALIYSDINNLTSQNNYDVKILYAESSENYLFGVSLPIDNQSLDFDAVKSLSTSQIENLDVESIDDEGNEFIIVVDDERFELLVTKEEYDLNSLGNFDFSGFAEYDLVLTRYEVLDIVNSVDGKGLLIEILLKNNGISGSEAEIARPILLNSIDSELSKIDISFREALFLLIISGSMEDSEGIVNIVEGYKQEEIEIYPNRISFRFLKLLPASTLKSFLFDEKEVVEE